MLHLIMMGCKTKEKQSWAVGANEITPGLLQEKVAGQAAGKGLRMSIKER
jgi:hypothetical protein